MTDPQNDGVAHYADEDTPEPRIVHRPDVQRMVAALLHILDQGRQQARERESRQKPAG